MEVEYRVRPTVRYTVTRYHKDDKSGGCETRGEFDNFETAYAVGYALAKHEHDQLGYPISDERIKYPDTLAPVLVEVTSHGTPLGD